MSVSLVFFAFFCGYSFIQFALPDIYRNFFVTALVGIGNGNFFLPKPFGGPMVLKHLLLLARVVQLDLLHAFAHPVEKESGSSPADSTWVQHHLCVKRPGRSKLECCRTNPPGC